MTGVQVVPAARPGFDLVLRYDDGCPVLEVSPTGDPVTVGRFVVGLVRAQVVEAARSRLGVA